MGPSEGVIEYVNWSILQIFRLDDLNVQGPSRIVAFLDGVEEVFDMVVRLFARQSQSSRRVESLDAGIGLPMPLHVPIATVLMK